MNPWLVVLQAGQRGATAWRTALDHAGGIAALRTADSQTLVRCGLNTQTIQRLRNPDASCLDRWNAWLGQSGHHLITLDDNRYPNLLAATPDAPLALWVRGTKLDILDSPMLAIVGSRHATHGGIDNAKAFGQEIGVAGLSIASGLAVGVDAASHQGAVDTIGGTLAVLGNGIDQIYPSENKGLAEQIEAQGLIVAEYPPGIPAARHRFPARNRIIAGLSLGVLVVEASTRSGSLITARRSGEYGREVFAIPGSIHNPLSRGCHQLIRQGAKLVESTADILHELAPRLGQALDHQEISDSAATDPPAAQSTGPDIASAEYQSVLNAIGFDPTGIDQIVSRTALTTAEVSSMLLLLELEGHVTAAPGGRYMRRA